MLKLIVVRRTKIILNYEEIVIGSCFKSVLFAFNSGLPLFFAQRRKPFVFDYLVPDQDLSFLKLDNQPRVLRSFDGEKEVGIKKELLWERMLFLMSLKGQVPLSDLCERMRWDGSTLTCMTNYEKIARVNFEICHFFGDDGCDKLLTLQGYEKQSYVCYDWIAFNRGGQHPVDYIETSDEFMNQVWFYPSGRIDGATKVKDACVVSHLTEDQLKLFDYSETMARFRLVSLMEDHNMKGGLDGYDKQGNPRYTKIKTGIIKREVQKDFEPVWNSGIKVKVPEVQEETLLRDLRYGAERYNRFLRHL
jgi:hypothetical protein|tara:strand:+ start:302 stop:1216 length:915 start_codon:yes stop_codon:yes gene_type:complete